MAGENVGELDKTLAVALWFLPVRMRAPVALLVVIVLLVAVVVTFIWKPIWGKQDETVAHRISSPVTNNAPIVGQQNGNGNTMNVSQPTVAGGGQSLLPSVTNITNCNGCTVVQGFPPDTDVSDLRAGMKGRHVDASATAEPSPIDPYAIEHPGFEIILVLSLGAPIAGRDNFILDLGLPDSTANRVSIYIDADRRLQVRIVDSQAKAHFVSVQRSFRTFRFNTAMLLVCQYGIIGCSSYMRVAINGREVGYKPEKTAIPFSREIDPKDLDVVHGADTKCNNGGVFAVAKLMMFTRTLTTTEEDGVMTSIDSTIDAQRHVVVFSGSQCLAYRHGTSSATDVGH